ncbi:MAG: hypothetical protein OEU26_25045 [Candidatus Tectomicrobia bacterium]|nr:hypothetical protein [Candidatus Tectomicrobia bacterium]
MNEESERWLHFAREDLKMAELALEAGIYNKGSPGYKRKTAILENINTFRRHRLRLYI